MRRFMKDLLIMGAIGASALWTAQQVVRRRRWFEYSGRSVIVTGGSRGLGLLIARELIAVGARVAICARTTEDVHAAVEELRIDGGQVFGMVCDVRNRDAVQSFVDSTVAQHGGVDVLFNVAGVMKVGPLDEMTEEDFREAMEINCWGSLHTMLAVLPVMRERGWGRIVNVASIGGSTPLISMNAEGAARQILRACQNGDGEVYISNVLSPVVWATRLAPTLTGEILALVNRLLPTPGGIGQNTAFGDESQSALSPSILTALSQKAAARNNELRPRRA